MATKAIEVRYDREGKIVLMAEADGYVMVRRPYKMPFILTRREWDAMRRTFGPWSALEAFNGRR